MQFSHIVSVRLNRCDNSQSTFVLTIAGSSQTTYMFMGDAWDSDGTSASNYMWLPLSVSTSAHTATLQDYAYWKVNPSTGKLYRPLRRCKEELIGSL